MDRDAFEKVAIDLEQGLPLTLENIGAIFGQAFWMLIVYMLLDANDAGRAIQGAINKLKSGSK